MTNDVIQLAPAAVLFRSALGGGGLVLARYVLRPLAARRLASPELAVRLANRSAAYDLALGLLDGHPDWDAVQVIGGGGDRTFTVLRGPHGPIR